MLLLLHGNGGDRKGDAVAIEAVALSPHAWVPQQFIEFAILCSGQGPQLRVYFRRLRWTSPLSEPLPRWTRFRRTPGPIASSAEMNSTPAFSSADWILHKERADPVTSVDSSIRFRVDIPTSASFESSC